MIRVHIEAVELRPKPPGLWLGVGGMFSKVITFFAAPDAATSPASELAAATEVAEQKNHKNLHAFSWDVDTFAIYRNAAASTLAQLPALSVVIGGIVVGVSAMGSMTEQAQDLRRS